jgi:hypothetical protein
VLGVTIAVEAMLAAILTLRLRFGHGEPWADAM